MCPYTSRFERDSRSGDLSVWKPDGVYIPCQHILTQPRPFTGSEQRKTGLSESISEGSWFSLKRYIMKLTSIPKFGLLAATLWPPVYISIVFPATFANAFYSGESRASLFTIH